MQLKDIEEGKRYATIWLHKPGDARLANVASLDAHDFSRLMEHLQCVEVIKKGVPRIAKSRPGVLVHKIDVHTGERQERDRWDQVTMSCAQIIAPWDELVAAYHDRVEQEEERRVQRESEREREAAERQERRAKEWMEETFAELRDELERAVQVMAGLEQLVIPGPVVTDEMIQKAVDMKYPEGNPYLNGTYEA